MREINPEVPDWLAAIIARLQAKNPADRFASAQEVAELLGQRLAQLQHPVPAPAPRRMRGLALGAVLVLLASLGGIFAFGVTHRPGAVAPPKTRPVAVPAPEPAPDREPVALALATVDPGETTYDTAEEAYRAGLAYLQLKQVEKSREPLEAALKPAPDAAYRVKIYHALLPAYRALPDVTKLFDALEYIIRHGASAPRRSLARTSMMAAAHERGKIDALVNRYEAKLKQDPDDRVSLYILSEVYDRLNPNPEKGARIAERLAALDQKAGKAIDVREEARRASQLVRAGKVTEGAELFEVIARADPKLSAWHYKEAALAWQKAKKPDRALKAAMASLASAGRPRRLLEYFWRRSLGDVFRAARRRRPRDSYASTEGLGDCGASAVARSVSLARHA